MNEQMSTLVNQLIAAEMNCSQTAGQVEEMQREMEKQREIRKELEE